MTDITVNNDGGSALINTGTITGMAAGGNMTVNQYEPSVPQHPGGASGWPLVFVNYRSTDEKWAATAVAQAWAARLGDDRVFLDNRSVGFGRPFDEQLLSAVANAAVLLAVIGRRWYGVQPDGRRLIDEESDWVRREISHALACRVPVVPVLVDGMALAVGELPQQLRELIRLQHCAINGERSSSDLKTMVDRVSQFDERLAGPPVSQR